MKTCAKCKGTGEQPEEDKLIPWLELPCSECHGRGRIFTAPAWLYKPIPANERGKPNCYYRQEIARLDHDPNEKGQWRVTIYDPRGPRQHHTRGRVEGELMDILRHYRPAETAAKLLDHWSLQAQWHHY